MLRSASGAFVALGPRGEKLALRGDRALVVALAGVRHADPVLRVRRERAVRIRHEEALHRRDRERIVAELELVERGLVGAHLARLLRLGGRGTLLPRLRSGRGGRSGGGRLLLASLLELADARVDVEVQVLLPLVRDLDLVRRHLELAAHLRDVGAQRFDLAREVEHRGAVGRPGDRGLDLRHALLDQPVLLEQLLAQGLHAAARFVVVEQALREAGRGGKKGEQRREHRPRESAHQYSPL